MTENVDIAWDSVAKRFKAYLPMHGRHQFLGYFQTPEDAATARTSSAWLYVQEFANHSDSHD